jgi:hypothetical protein
MHVQMPKGSDESWALKLYGGLAARSHFSKPRLSNSAFIVKHYADAVSYEVASFLEKNKVGEWVGVLCDTHLFLCPPQCQSLFLSLSPCHTHTHTHTLSLSLSLSLSLFHTHSPSFFPSLYLSLCLYLSHCFSSPIPSERLPPTALAPIAHAQDTIFEEALVMLRASTVSLVAALFSEKGKSKEREKKATVGSQFQISLGCVVQCAFNYLCMSVSADELAGHELSLMVWHQTLRAS